MIIDTHVHMTDGGWPPGSIKHLSAEQMVAAMDKYGISEMWISSETGLARDFSEANRKLHEFTKPYSDRFLNYATVNPNYIEQVEDEIRRCIEDYGFGAIKLHPWLQAFCVHTDISHRIVELAIEYNVPVMYHDGTPPYSETLQIASLAGLYPEAKIILGHAGMFDSYRSAIEASLAHDNIYLCICGNIVGDAKEILEQANPDRILFGTDYGASDRENLIADRIGIIDYACEDAILRENVMCKNAQRLLGRF